MNTTPKTARQLREIIGVLAVQFVLGVTLTTVIDYNQDKPTVLQNIFLGAHFFLACYLLFISSRALMAAYRAKRSIPTAWVGLGGIIAAFASGGMAAQTGNDWAVLVMAISFIVSLLAYGAQYVQLKHS